MKPFRILSLAVLLALAVPVAGAATTCEEAFIDRYGVRP